MEVDRQRIQDDLRGIVRGDVLCDPVSVQLYASDASIYQVAPAGIVRPASHLDVVATIKYAGERVHLVGDRERLTFRGGW